MRSEDVNDYIREIAGEEFTAKDFRTWAGTVLAVIALREFEAFDSTTSAKKIIVRAIESVARRLGNTPSVCRKCYVHPAVVDGFLDGHLLDVLAGDAATPASAAASPHRLRAEESAVVLFLE